MMFTTCATEVRTVCVTVGVAALLATWECRILKSPECIIGAQRPEERTLRCHHPMSARLRHMAVVVRVSRVWS